MGIELSEKEAFRAAKHIVEVARQEADHLAALEESKLLLVLDKMKDHREHAIMARFIIEEQHLIIKNGFHIALTILSKQIQLKSRTTTIRIYMAWGVSNEHVTSDISGSLYDGWSSHDLINQLFDPLNHYHRR